MKKAFSRITKVLSIFWHTICSMFVKTKVTYKDVTGDGKKDIVIHQDANFASNNIHCKEEKKDE